MFRITLNQKRFLIIWIGIHSLALFVNVFNIEGRTDTSNWTISTKVYNYVFTKNSNYDNDFWPFTEFTKQERYYIEPINSYEQGTWSYGTAFNGIFYNYDYSEFVFYMLSGLAFIYLPKLWVGKDRD
jgi:hypothetical protein